MASGEDECESKGVLFLCMQTDRTLEETGDAAAIRPVLVLDVWLGDDAIEKLLCASSLQRSKEVIAQHGVWQRSWNDPNGERGSGGWIEPLLQRMDRARAIITLHGRSLTLELLEAESLASLNFDRVVRARAHREKCLDLFARLETIATCPIDAVETMRRCYAYFDAMTWKQATQMWKAAQLDELELLCFVGVSRCWRMRCRDPS